MLVGSAPVVGEADGVLNKAIRRDFHGLGEVLAILGEHIYVEVHILSKPAPK